MAGRSVPKTTMSAVRPMTVFTTVTPTCIPIENESADPADATC